MNQPKTSIKPPTKMVIFDYSGTLSLDAALFGQTDHLILELKQSGLWQLGINSLDIFWQEILNPTWQEGSTSTTGYKQLMAERAAQFLGMQNDTVQEAALRNCVSEFVDSYLSHSHIAPEWKPILSRLLVTADTLVVIATDHYLEATDHIFQQLEGLEIDSVSVLKVNVTAHENDRVMVANSAELGYRKSHPEFWNKLKDQLQIQHLSYVVLLDDFVSNERRGNSYVESERIAARMKHVTDLLTTIFQARIQVYPFVIDPSAKSKQAAYKAMISDANRFIVEALAEGKG